MIGILARVRVVEAADEADILIEPCIGATYQRRSRIKNSISAKCQSGEEKPSMGCSDLITWE